MKVLVTGASGMVGRNLLSDPRTADYEILAPRRSELSLTDAASCDAWFAQHRPDAVIHLAAVVGGIQANINEPVRFLVENTQIALNLFGAARANGIQTFLNVGSSCMYPRNIDDVLSLPMLLSAPLEPTNEGYALAKIVSWKLAEYMRRENPSLQYKTIVPCNLYGLYDHFDAVRSHMVPAAIMKVVAAAEEGRDTVEIWGDGTARREFMFARDLADFIWTWLPRIEDLPDLMNVGVGRDHSVTEYYEAITAAVGYSGGFAYDPSKPAGMKRKLLDVTQQTELGWQPKTRLADGIRDTLKYYQAVRTA